MPMTLGMAPLRLDQDVLSGMPAAPSNALLMEDSGYILLEDDSHILLET